MSKKKKSVDINFGIVLLFIVVIGIIIFVVGRHSANTKYREKQNENLSENTGTQETSKTNIYSNNVIMLDIGKLSDKWQVVEKPNGSILY